MVGSPCSQKVPFPPHGENFKFKSGDDESEKKRDRGERGNEASA